MVWTTNHQFEIPNTRLVFQILKYKLVYKFQIQTTNQQEENTLWFSVFR